MENQHKKIKGYRDLSEKEIELMNKIKEHGETTKLLLDDLRALRDGGVYHDCFGVPTERADGLTEEQASESFRCLEIAQENLQTGQMWFVRSVALPDSF